MKRYGLDDLMVVALCCLVLGCMGGYGWCLYHKSLDKPIEANSIYIADLALEISNGNEFFLPADDKTILHFLPLRGAYYEMAVRREKRK